MLFQNAYNAMQHLAITFVYVLDEFASDKRNSLFRKAVNNIFYQECARSCYNQIFFLFCRQTISNKCLFRIGPIGLHHVHIVDPQRSYNEHQFGIDSGQKCGSGFWEQQQRTFLSQGAAVIVFICCFELRLDPPFEAILSTAL